MIRLRPIISTLFWFLCAVSNVLADDDLGLTNINQPNHTVAPDGMETHLLSEKIIRLRDLERRYDETEAIINDLIVIDEAEKCLLN